MNIALTPEQENLIQAKIKTGEYKNTQQVIEVALCLLEEYEKAESDWSKSVREKIQAAISASENNPPVDGETFINSILDNKKEESEDFFAIAGIWEDRDVTAKTLRQQP